MVAALLCDSQCCSPVAAPTFSRAFGLGSANFFTGHTQGASCLFDIRCGEIFGKLQVFCILLSHTKTISSCRCPLFWPSIHNFSLMLVATCRHLPLGPPRLHFRPGQGLRDDRHHASPRHFTIGRQQHTWLVCLLPMGCTHQGIIFFHPNRITQILGTLQRKVK